MGVLSGDIALNPEGCRPVDPENGYTTSILIIK
jgi:hypothetical protein